MSAMPADSNSLPFRPSDNALTDRVDSSSDFMTGHSRILDARPDSFLGHGITVANAAGFNLDAHPPGAGLRDFALENFKRPLRSSYLHGAHLRHNSSD
jgi:hypothetical protein